MELRINEKCDCSESCDEKDYFIFRIKVFQIKFFDDYGTKYLFIHIGKKVFRWDW